VNIEDGPSAASEESWEKFFVAPAEQMDLTMTLFCAVCMCLYVDNPHFERCGIRDAPAWYIRGFMLVNYYNRSDGEKKGGTAFFLLWKLILIMVKFICV
jgi:hypothetical protein